MFLISPNPIRTWQTSIAFGTAFGVMLFVGCSAEPTSFSPNRLLTYRLESDLGGNGQPLEQQVHRALLDAFGTPDQPLWPDFLSADPQLGGLIDEDFLRRAAGPVGRDHNEVESGLYRKHCSQCHGINGDGRGPAAALLSPYPRDFRRGTFKFKRSISGARPLMEDLIRTIEHGVSGTSMPAMANLKLDRHYNDDIEVVAQYVVYLSIRGETERTLMLDHARNIDLEAGESLYDPNLVSVDAERWEEQRELVRRTILSIARRWAAPQFEPIVGDGLKLDANNAQVWSSLEKQEFMASARRGQEVFRGTTAACSQCHGENGDGQGKLRDFDEWTKDWTVRAGIDPKDPKQWRPLKKLGLLKPVPAIPRNLQWGVFRNGSDVDSIYRSIVHGIEGTPMPAAAILPEVKNGLTEKQVWDLVNFCQALGHAGLRTALQEKGSADDQTLEPLRAGGGTP